MAKKNNEAKIKFTAETGEFTNASEQADKLDKSLRDAGDGAESSADGFTIAKGAIAYMAAIGERDISDTEALNIILGGEV